VKIHVGPDHQSNVPTFTCRQRIREANTSCQTIRYSGLPVIVAVDIRRKNSVRVSGLGERVGNLIICVVVAIVPAPRSPGVVPSPGIVSGRIRSLTNRALAHLLNFNELARAAFRLR
jgi:hypothetical protein